MKTYTIKPLEWRKVSEGYFAAMSIFGSIYASSGIQLDGSLLWWPWINTSLISESPFGTREAAQAAAEAWHRERIEAALEVKGE